MLVNEKKTDESVSLQRHLGKISRYREEEEMMSKASKME